MQFGAPVFSSDLARVLEALEAPRVDIPVIQPAEPFLDMAGEDLRRRIFLTESETGESLCLRPEFTIPVCSAHIAENVATPRRYSYLGQVFRQRREGGNEFYQAGVEDLGEPDEARADARALSEARALIAQFVPGADLSVILGDQSVFEAVVAGLGLPAGWQKRLVHAFGNGQALDGNDYPSGQSRQLGAARSLGGRLSRQRRCRGPRGAYRAGDAGTGYSTHASRSPAEIAARLIGKQALDSTRLSATSLDALKTFLALDVPLDRAASALADFARDAGLDISGAQQAFEARLSALSARGEDLGAIRWRAAFGRPLDYYTGLVFEISAGRDNLVLAGGGRYDRMMTLLGAREPIPAVGFSLWLDRIETVRAQAMTLTVALPSKGRMKDDAIATFARAGLTVSAIGNDRSYRGRIDGIDDVEVAFLSASEIARELGAGAVDFGVTGEDLVRESLARADERVEIAARLGFGNADVVVAVPDIWKDVDSMADLGDVAADFRSRHGRRLTIATKYWRLTQNFFSTRHGIQLYRIVESLGATEGAPASGAADIIVDITSTGSTLTANHLRVLSDGVILRSEACLVRARKAGHDNDPRVASLIEAVRSAS
jgi:ATP phosphoribosyltransferase regulatory subunit